MRAQCTTPRWDEQFSLTYADFPCYFWSMDNLQSTRGLARTQKTRSDKKHFLTEQNYPWWDGIPKTLLVV
jgi:hypothetical protein